MWKIVSNLLGESHLDGDAKKWSLVKPAKEIAIYFGMHHFFPPAVGGAHIAFTLVKVAHNTARQTIQTKETMKNTIDSLDNIKNHQSHWNNMITEIISNYEKGYLVKWDFPGSGYLSRSSPESQALIKALKNPSGNKYFQCSALKEYLDKKKYWDSEQYVVNGRRLSNIIVNAVAYLRDTAIDNEINAVPEHPVIRPYIGPHSQKEIDSARVRAKSYSESTGLLTCRYTIFTAAAAIGVGVGWTGAAAIKNHLS